jgi:Domain of unknown function (DUF4595) with porin-like fold
MKKVIIALAAIITMASCKKENLTPVTPDVPSVSKKLVKTTGVYDNGTPETEVYTYDVQGRVAAIKDDEITETFDYVSASSLIVSARFNSTGNLQQTRECTLNSNGYVTKLVIKNGIGGIVYTYDFTYNAEGYMINRKGTSPGGSTYEIQFNIVNGNTVSYKLFYDDVLSSNIEFTYDAAKLNKNSFSNGCYWTVPVLFGKGSKNLCTAVKTYDTAGTLTYHTQYAYELDADGYVVKQNYTIVLTGKQGVNTNTYQ